MKKKLIPKVSSLLDLQTKAKADPQYLKLAIVSARNLGGTIKDGDLDSAIRWLGINASETSEAGVVDEINYVRDILDHAK
jgi:hypothetical protein